MNPVTFSDHPDIVGGVKWSDCELRWINDRDDQWKGCVAELERELDEWKTKYAAKMIESQDAKDAARYRFIRERGEIVLFKGVATTSQQQEIDAAIDAAMKGGE